MNDAIDMLRPKAREALENLGYFLTGTHNHNDFYAIRTELLRLAEIENERWNVVAARNAAIGRAERAEARIAELEAERDALLRDCWEACGGKGPDSSDDELVGTISTMRVGLERWQKRACDAEAERDALQAENAQLRDVLADRDMDREMAARSKLELIEANRQLDALRARIEDARTQRVPTYRGQSWYHEIHVPSDFSGKRVALVTDELQRLALSLADDYARADIEFLCIGDGTWYRTTAADPEDAGDVARALRYLDLRAKSSDNPLPYIVERGMGKIRFRNKD